MGPRATQCFCRAFSFPRRSGRTTADQPLQLIRAIRAIRGQQSLFRAATV